jgi:RimJ/RimL family protein N-acetyltransferase
MTEKLNVADYANFRSDRLVTERLLLRRLEPADADAVFAYRSLPEVFRYQNWEPESADDVRSLLRNLAESEPYTPGKWFQFGITLRETGTLVGDCGVQVLESDSRQAEVGITLGPGYQGQGYATEALRAVLDLLFLRLRKHRVFGSVDPHNRASIALMRRIGMRQEAHFVRSLWFKDDWVDDLVFARLENEWRPCSNPKTEAFQIAAMSSADWPEVALIYRQGIEEGLATFETEVPSWDDWDAGHLPVCRFVARSASGIQGWAALAPTSRRRCYEGVAEASVYVARNVRRQGVGAALLKRIVTESEAAGIWTLQGITFEENRPSLQLQMACGFRVVGYRERIGQLHGQWRTTVLTERRR